MGRCTWVPVPDIEGDNMRHSPCPWRTHRPPFAPASQSASQSARCDSFGKHACMLTKLQVQSLHEYGQTYLVLFGDCTQVEEGGRLAGSKSTAPSRPTSVWH